MRQMDDATLTTRQIQAALTFGIALIAPSRQIHTHHRRGIATTRDLCGVIIIQLHADGVGRQIDILHQHPRRGIQGGIRIGSIDHTERTRCHRIDHTFQDVQRGKRGIVIIPASTQTQTITTTTQRFDMLHRATLRHQPVALDGCNAIDEQFGCTQITTHRQTFDLGITITIDATTTTTHDAGAEIAKRRTTAQTAGTLYV